MSRRWVVNASPLILLGKAVQVGLLRGLADERVVPGSGGAEGRSRWGSGVLTLTLLLLTIAGCASSGTPYQSLDWLPEGDCWSWEIVDYGDIGSFPVLEGRAVVIQDYLDGPTKEVPIPGVKLITQSTNRLRRSFVATAGEDGRFFIPEMPNGEYRLGTCIEGFSLTELTFHIDRKASPRDLVVEMHLAA